MRVVVCEPGKKAYVTEIEDSLAALQETVHGNIESYYPFEQEIAIICNEDGKIDGESRPCRGIYSPDGELMDIVFGTFMICDCSTDKFASLKPDDEQFVMETLGAPEAFYRIGDEIHVIKIKEEEN